jgi:transposase InsO family protein
MDLVGPARVCSTSGKWYVLVIVDDYSRYAWVFFLANKGETFGFVRDLILRLKNDRNGDVVRAICNDNAVNLKTLSSKPFVVIWVSNTSFLLPMWLVRIV